MDQSDLYKTDGLERNIQSSYHKFVRNTARVLLPTYAVFSIGCAGMTINGVGFGRSSGNRPNDSYATPTASAASDTDTIRNQNQVAEEITPQKQEISGLTKIALVILGGAAAAYLVSEATKDDNTTTTPPPPQGGGGENGNPGGH